MRFKQPHNQMHDLFVWNKVTKSISMFLLQYFDYHTGSHRKLTSNFTLNLGCGWDTVLPRLHWRVCPRKVH